VFSLIKNRGLFPDRRERRGGEVGRKFVSAVGTTTATTATTATTTVTTVTKKNFRNRLTNYTKRDFNAETTHLI